MNIPIVIQSLNELACWLECSKQNQDIIHEIIKELEMPNINELKLRQLRVKLSTKMLFNPKWMGEIYVPNFDGDGTPFAWSNYLSQVADICQRNL